MIIKRISKRIKNKLEYRQREKKLKKSLGFNIDNLEKIENCPKKAVVIYMSGKEDFYYQFLQWLKPFEELNKRCNVIIIVRTYSMALKMLEMQMSSIFKIIYLSNINLLMDFYKKNEPSSILYVNNAQSNFQSLIYNRSYHIHLNHGESEKESMYSNQSKAYDYVLTVGQRGIDRYKENIINFDEKKYISIGRPQLDFIEDFKFESSKRIILYAPTWEGFSESMNYCSIDKYGVEIVKTILNSNKYTLIYRPHPNTGIRLKKIDKANKEIIKMIDTNENGYINNDTNIISIFNVVDFAFFDNSSVMIDYLHFDKPAKYLEIQEDLGLRYLKEAFCIFEQNSNIVDVLENEIKLDPKKDIREKIKKYYLGNYDYMESTNAFCNFIINLLQK